MSETLGEKLRNARENRGITISQVSEQTRIATHYLNAIEANDFSVLPGGIFNKGFIRSFAKCVGFDEHEALAEYNAFMAASEPSPEQSELYSPEVLTDDRSRPSMASTVILIVLILGVLIGAMVFAIYWLWSDGEAAPPAAPQATETKRPAETAPTPVPENFSVEIIAKDKVLEFSYEVDGEKVPVKVMKPGETLSLQPKDSFKGSFYRSIVPAVTLRLNGEEIALRKPVKPYLSVDLDRNNIAEVASAKAYGESGAEQPATESAPVANRPFRTQRPAVNAASAPPAPPKRTESPAR